LSISWRPFVVGVRRRHRRRFQPERKKPCNTCC
jgi:hypothetical protein